MTRDTAWALGAVGLGVRTATVGDPITVEAEGGIGRLNLQSNERDALSQLESGEAFRVKT